MAVRERERVVTDKKLSTDMKHEATEAECRRKVLERDRAQSVLLHPSSSLCTTELVTLSPLLLLSSLPPFVLSLG